jgi:DNA-directed RNA polymerase specialized sigma24 family protein
MPVANETMRREEIFQGILDTMRKWPSLDRQIFVQAHYHGQSVETISSALKLNEAEVCQILHQCDSDLYAALKQFRDSGEWDTLRTPTGPVGRAASSFLFADCVM